MGKIVFVSYLFAPLARAAGVNRAYFVRHLAEAGWDVDVVTGADYKSLWMVIQKDPSLLDILPPEVKIHRYDSLKGWLRYDLAALKHRLAGGSPPLRRRWIEDAESSYRPQTGAVVLAVLSSVENAVLAYRIAEKHDLPLALHFVDDTLGVDAAIVRRAGLVTAVTEQICDNLRERYAHPRIEVVRNGYTKEVEVAEEKPVGDPIRVVYAGSFAGSMRPELLAKGYELLARRRADLADKIEIDFYGQKGGYYYHLRLRRHASRRVRFRGYLGIEELSKRLQEYDIGFVSTSGQVSFSSKAYTYLNAGLPIFAAAQGAGLAEFVETNEIGLATDLEAAEIADGLARLVSGRESLAGWRRNVLSIRKQFSMREQVDRMLRAFESLAPTAS